MKQLKADLHMHSNWSDGSQTVSQLIIHAKTQGFEVLAITDLDTNEGQDEAVLVGIKHQVTVIPGIEISAYDPITRRMVSVLGYHCSKTEKLNGILLSYIDERNNAVLIAIKRIQKAGYAIDPEAVQAYAGKGNILYRHHIMHALVDRGYSLSIYGELYEKFFGRNGIAKVDSHYISAVEAVKLIKSCSGSAVLAHPYLYDSLGMLPQLTSGGLDGLEAFHPSHSLEQRHSLYEAARRYELFITGGSDTYGFYSERNDLMSHEEFFMAQNHPLLKGRYNV